MRQIFPLLLLAIAACAALAQEPGSLRRGSYAVFAGEGEILSQDNRVIRRASEGEVVRIRAMSGGWAEIGSAIESLSGGKTKLENLKPSTEEANAAWITAGTARIEAERKKVESLERAPSPDEDAALESEDNLRPPIPIAAMPADRPVDSPVMGWFAPGRGATISGLQPGTDGSVYISGTIAPPFHMSGIRGWQSESPDSEGAPLPFIARLDPDLETIADFVVFLPSELGPIDQLRFDPEGGVWAAARGAGDAVAGAEAGQSDRFLIRFSRDLRAVERVLPISHKVKGFALDSRNRPVVLRGSSGRSGGGLLVRYFTQGRFERAWPEAPDGLARRLVLDFSSPALANGPFAIWANRADVFPDFPTPLAPWGSPANAGKPVTWTHAPNGLNPIRGADLKPEVLAIDREDCVLVAGTIPFNMGNPDFDPFLLRFSPTGKLLWANCFLGGLLSEPDQKAQALAVDPSNGDILVSYWQHGNNVQTLLLDPRGWMSKFTGNSGNLKISWIGRIDAATGVLKNSTYLHATLPESANTDWPDLNSSAISDMSIDVSGRVYIAGETATAFPTTDGAFLKDINERGLHPMFAVLRPDLSGPVYSTYLSSGIGAVHHLVLLPGAVVLAGTHETVGPALPVRGSRKFLSDKPPRDTKEGAFLAILPLPKE